MIICNSIVLTQNLYVSIYNRTIHNSGVFTVPSMFPNDFKNFRVGHLNLKQTKQNKKHGNISLTPFTNKFNINSKRITIISINSYYLLKRGNISKTAYTDPRPHPHLFTKCIFVTSGTSPHIHKLNIDLSLHHSVCWREGGGGIKQLHNCMLFCLLYLK